jgi:hypothetical protein
MFKQITIFMSVDINYGWLFQNNGTTIVIMSLTCYCGEKKVMEITSHNSHFQHRLRRKIARHSTPIASEAPIL